MFQFSLLEVINENAETITNPGKMITINLPMQENSYASRLTA